MGIRSEGIIPLNHSLYVRKNQRSPAGPITLLGPWMGEFGWELIYWQGFVRYYCEQNPEEYVIAAGPRGHSALYESACEYIGLDFLQPLESNMYLPRAFNGRCGYYSIASDLCDLLQPDKLGLPSRLHEKEWIEFGRPRFNQSFIKLGCGNYFTDLIRTQVPGPYIVLYPRIREIEPSKNWSVSRWVELGLKLQDFGFYVVTGGVAAVLGGLINPINWGITPDDWTGVQLELAKSAEFLVSGESGSGFLPGLTGTPGLVFGDKREYSRYKDVENIFRTPLQYITTRNPGVEDIVRWIRERF